jgi:hypothetical protein
MDLKTAVWIGRDGIFSELFPIHFFGIRDLGLIKTSVLVSESLRALTGILPVCKISNLKLIQNPTNQRWCK